MSRTYRRGFSLIEVVLAIGILGVILVTFQAVLTSSALARTTVFGDVALVIAESKLAALRAAGYEALPASGAVADSNLAQLPQGTESLEISAYNDTSKSVAVSVSFVDPHAGSRTVTLTTLITKTGGL